jgi:tetratricopeptide (TPR) repeat protein
MKTRFLIALLGIAMLTSCTLAQENTTGYWLKKGYELSLNGSDEEALQAYEKALQIDPENSLAWINKANVLYRLNRTSESSQAYRKALEITDNMIEADPRNATLWLGKGILHNNVGDIEEAVAALDNASKIDPKDDMAWKMKGVLLARDLQRYDDAVEAYDAALQINPEDGEVWNLKGDALKSLGRQAEAEATYSKARELGYETPSASSLVLTNVVSVGNDEFIEMTNDGTGTQTFENLTLTIDGGESILLPDFTLGPGESIRFHLGEGDSNETDVYLNGDLSLDDVAGNLTLKDSTGTLDKFAAYWTPDATSEYWIEKSYELWANGSLEEALGALNNATDVDPQNAMAWLSKAQILGPNLGRYNESLEACDKAIEIDPENPDSWRLRGLILMNLGRDEEALAAFEEAIEFDPQNGYTWYLKGTLLQHLGREGEAEVAFTRAEELGFTSPLAGMIAITEIVATGEDEFVEIANNLDEAKNLEGWTLVVDEDEMRSVVLPDYTLEPAAKVRFHFGAGEGAENDLFMESEIALNDDATNVTLRDEAGREVSFLGFETLLDGRVVGTRGSGEFGY